MSCVIKCLKCENFCTTDDLVPHYCPTLTERLMAIHPGSLESVEKAVDELETSAKPTRYNKPGASLEVWDAIEQLGLNYMQGNVLKYSYRYQEKNGPEDLVKAINYMVKMISQETGIDYYELHKLSPEELAKRIKK